MSRSIDFTTLRTILYNDGTGTTGTVTLTESAANFRRLRIYYKNNTGGHQSVDVISPNNMYVDLTTIQKDDSGQSTKVYGQISRKLISGNSITTISYEEFNINNTNICGVSNSNFIFITRVEGWVV